MGGSADLSLLFDVFVLAQRTKQLLGEAMEDGPLSPEEYAVYSAVDAYAPLSTSELARHLGIPVTTMHDHVRQMVERGHLTRHPDPRDGRAQLLRLSPEGAAVHGAAGREFDRAVGPVVAALSRSPDEVRGALADLASACEIARERLALGDLAA